jgi:hypothetical protein
MIFLATITAAPTAIAQHVPINLPSIRADLSGSWYNPAQSGHGLMLEILDNQRVVLAWYTYDASGAPLWLFGEGTVQGQQIVADLGAFSGGRPPADWDQGELMSEPFGTVTMTVQSCNSATLSWTSDHPDFGSGELELQRLSWIQGQRCNADELYSMQVHYSFERRTQGFKAVFADLPEDWQGADYELDYRRELLPVPLSDFAGLRLTGHNRSDDLAMLVTAPLRGLLPGALYRVELEAELATNVPHGCAGVGGSPGDSVYVKLGASGEEPLAEVDPVDDWLRLNFDFGVQSQAGANVRVAGTLGNSQDCENGVDVDYEIKTVTTEGQPLLVSAGDDGTLWLIAGTDSAFEGFTQYYIVSLTARLEPYEPEPATPATGRSGETSQG